ncbi:hypothetical protein HanRHA438_Chr13g0579531 [Helianthus annuus]|nr:hypothetical protein HanIR_Chr13g0618771 [Helianthus annuus]KAJ0856535.1 hypothetical protein HanRHA438_Chr13g0579531 [Helianthus annuus]
MIKPFSQCNWYKLKQTTGGRLVLLGRVLWKINKSTVVKRKRHFMQYRILD